MGAEVTQARKQIALAEKERNEQSELLETLQQEIDDANSQAAVRELHATNLSKREIVCLGTVNLQPKWTRVLLSVGPFSTRIHTHLLVL